MDLAFILLCAVVMPTNVDGNQHNMVKQSDDPHPLENVLMHTPFIHRVEVSAILLLCVAFNYLTSKRDIINESNF